MLEVKTKNNNAILKNIFILFSTKPFASKIKHYTFTT